MLKNNAIIINFCPTGMVPTRHMTPYVPITPSEIIEQVHEAYTLGITIVHLHARNDDETPTYRPAVYQKIFEGVRAYCPELVICASTSGRNANEFEKRSAVIELKPDMCSLTLSSLNFLQQASVNSPDMICRLAEKMKTYGVKPELECFDLGMINYGKYLAAKGYVEPPYYWNLLFGNIAGFQSNITQIGTAIRELDGEHQHIALGGLGKDQLTVNSLAIAFGYGIRVGIEDNIWWDEARSRKASNIDLLKRVHQLIALHGKQVMPAVHFGKLGFYNEQTFPVGI